MKIQKAAVIGAGLMGSAIAQVLSAAGIEVILKDLNQDLIDHGLANIKRMYDSRVKKGTLTQTEADYLFADVKGSTDYSGFEDLDLVIEAASETIEVKKRIFSELDQVCSARTILATNTSALSISEIAEATRRPEQVLGMHFFYPAQAMRLVEVIPGIKTLKKNTDIILALCRQVNKIPVRVEECPGFLVNRLIFPYLNEALHVLQEGKISAAELDRAAVEFGLPIGPLKLLDMSGLDVCAHVSEYLFSEYGLRFKPSPLLALMSEKGFLGQKSGAGFYIYPSGEAHSKDAPATLNPELGALIARAKVDCPAEVAQAPFDVMRIVLPMFNEALYAIQEKVTEPLDVDVAMQWGCGLSRGLISLAEEKGFVWCLEQLESHKLIYGERFRPAWILAKLVRAQIHDFRALIPEPVVAT